MASLCSDPLAEPEDRRTRGGHERVVRDESSPRGTRRRLRRELRHYPYLLEGHPRPAESAVQTWRHAPCAIDHDAREALVGALPSVCSERRLPEHLTKARRHLRSTRKTRYAWAVEKPPVDTGGDGLSPGGAGSDSGRDAGTDSGSIAILASPSPPRFAVAARDKLPRRSPALRASGLHPSPHGGKSAAATPGIRRRAPARVCARARAVRIRARSDRRAATRQTNSSSSVRSKQWHPASSASSSRSTSVSRRVDSTLVRRCFGARGRRDWNGLSTLLRPRRRRPPKLP